VALPPLPCLYCPPDGSPCDRCDDDGPAESAPVRELAIDLSNLEGIWADVYARQEALHAKHQRKARTAWRKATAGLDLAALIAAFRRHALMIPDAPAPGTDHESPQAAKHHRAELRRLARSMAAGFLAGVNDQPDYSGLLDTVTGALTAASGEGTAAALAVSAAGAGYTGFAWAKAARDGRQEPDQHTVTGWLAKIIAGAVTDLAAALTAGAVAGNSEAAMLAAASAVLRKARSVTAFTDQAMASTITAAMAAAYAALGGIHLLDFLTAGDGKVCARCQQCSDDGPYTPRDYPGSQHPRCRCVPSPRGGVLLPLSAFAAYLINRAA
jgi:hypothetical protein